MQVGIHELYPFCKGGYQNCKIKFNGRPPVQIRLSKNRKISRFIPRVAKSECFNYLQNPYWNI